MDEKYEFDYDDLHCKDMPFLSGVGVVFYTLQALFKSGAMNPWLLSEATGVEFDLCKKFCGANLLATLHQMKEE